MMYQKFGEAYPFFDTHLIKIKQKCTDRWKAALVVGRCWVTSAKLGGLSRAYWITTIQLGR